MCRRVRFGRGRPSAQLPLVVALAKRHAPRAQDVIGGDGVEMKVGQRKGKKERLRRESELSRRPGRGAIIFVERAVEGNVQRLADPAIDLGGRGHLPRRYRPVYRRRPTSPDKAKTPVFTASSPNTE